MARGGVGWRATLGCTRCNGSRVTAGRIASLAPLVAARLYVETRLGAPLRSRRNPGTTLRRDTARRAASLAPQPGRCDLQAPRACQTLCGPGQTFRHYGVCSTQVPATSATLQVLPHGHMVGAISQVPRLCGQQSLRDQQAPDAGRGLHTPTTHSSPLVQSTSAAQHPACDGTQVPAWFSFLQFEPQGHVNTPEQVSSLPQSASRQQ